ncbi:MAG: pilus assembly protein PilZ [Geobacteraceae bacterium GWC2_58_44]|nr:MAG: pilus assembly protein PilZ [Geobacteraceae bacterium GWC2_58_44]HBG08176.1 PilZ domain-containing protein [Geobacter sp.]
MQDTRILMVVKEAEARAAYEEALRRVGVSYDIAGSFDEVLRLSIDNAYSGLIIDILTLIRSSKEEKLIAYDCLNFYPSLRVKWDARQKTMNLSPLEQTFSADTEATLDYFIESRCRPFTARSLRKFNRKDTSLALLLSTCCDFSDGASLKTFTVNISQGGAFVHTTHSFVKGQTVWLRFLELPDAEPIKAVVCWSIEWGACRSIPGIGVMFEFRSQEQATELWKMARL